VREKLALSNVVGGEHVDTVDVRRTNLMDPSSGEAGAAPVSGPEAVGRAMPHQARHGRHRLVTGYGGQYGASGP